MKTFFKWLAVLLASGLVLLLALLGTIGWWLPPLAESQARTALEGLGFEPVELSVERLGYSGITVTGLALERQEVHLALRSVILDYSLTGLIIFHQAKNLSIDGLDGTLMLPELLAAIQMEPSDTSAEEAPGSFSLPQDMPLPVAQVLVSNSTLTLEADGWRKRLEWDAFVEDGAPVSATLHAADNADSLSLSSRLDKETLLSETTFQLQSNDPFTWAELLVSLGLFQFPEGILAHAKAFKLEGALRAKGPEPRAWTVIGSAKNIEADHPQGRATAGLLNFGANGDGLVPEKVWVGLFNGQVHGPLSVNWDAATLETLSPARAYLKLEGWELTGDLSAQGLGDINATAGPIRVLLDGPWASLHNQQDIEPFSGRLMMPESPLEVYTGKGSVFGQTMLQMEVSPATPERQLEAQATIGKAEINAGTVSATADKIALNIAGTIPDALSATLTVDNAVTSWAEGTGQLEGVRGEIAIANLMPLAMPEKQTLTFDRVSQGKLEMSNGEVSVHYQAPTDSTPIVLSLTAGGQFADGYLAGRVTVTLGEAISAEADLLLQNVSLTQLAALFPQFQGKIQGRVSGEIPIKVVGNRIVLRPGYLEMAAGETGKFSYTRQGWLTQDPSLDPVAYAQSKSLSELMKESNGAAILTELALRDLTLTAFRIDILKPGQGDRRVIVHLEGDGKFKDVTIPIVQDVRIGGDVKEALNLLLMANEKIEFGN